MYSPKTGRISCKGNAGGRQRLSAAGPGPVCELEHNPVRWSRLRCAAGARPGATRRAGVFCGHGFVAELARRHRYMLRPAPARGTKFLRRTQFNLTGLCSSPKTHEFRGTLCHRDKKRLGLSAAARAFAGPEAPHPLGLRACGPTKKRGVGCNPTRRSRSASMSHEFTQRRTRVETHSAHHITAATSATAERKFRASLS